MIKELEYELTKKDYINFLYFHKFKHIKGWKIPLIFIIIACILYFINANIITFILVCIFVISFSLLSPYLFALRFENIKMTVKIDSDKNTYIVSEYAVNEYNWCNIKKIYNTKNYFFIYVLNNLSTVIPKRIFETEQEMNETWELIQECYNKYREESK